MNDDIDQIVNWALSDEPVTPKGPPVRFFPLGDYDDPTLINKIRLVRSMADAAWGHPATYEQASRLETEWSDLMTEARKRGIQDDIDAIVFYALKDGALVEPETAPVPQPKTMPKPPEHKRWRCMVVGCNPILDEDTAKQHHAHTGHRVAKWPIRSKEGKRRARERNRNGYYRPYNEAAAWAHDVMAGRHRDDGFDNTEHQNHDIR